MKALAPFALALALFAPVHAGAEGGSSAGLPPFLAKMQRHDVPVRVLRRGASGEVTPAPAGLPVSIMITASGSKVRSYDAVTGDGGVARFSGIPTNPEVQESIGYLVTVQSDGVKFPFKAAIVPLGPEGAVEVVVDAVSASADDLALRHTHIELFPDEENLVVRHSMELSNRGRSAVDLSQQPGGGLRLPLPAGGKHPELHEDQPQELVEVRGTDLYYKGVVLPGGRPTEITVVYTIAYDREVFEWSQTSPVRTTAAFIVAPTGRQTGQRVDLPLSLATRGDAGTVQERTLDGGRRFSILRIPDANLAPGQPLRFAIGGLPTGNQWKLGAMGVALLGVLALVFFGFRGAPAGDADRLSRAHLENERDRLHKALDRLRKAVEKGRLSPARFEREQEAITARLVSLYRALDRLEKT
jgi:hypothetical protein